MARTELTSYFREGQFSTPRNKDFIMSPIEIIYEDEDILVVNKPAGLPMHPNLDKSRENLVDTIKKMRSPDLYLGIHQRLDLQTSGVVLFSKNTRVNPSLARQFNEHSVKKIYWALVLSPGHLRQREWECNIPLGEPLKRGGAVTWNRPNCKSACTIFRLIQRQGKLLWLEATLKSGRKHQIRAHLAAQKMPILGDTLYRGSTAVEIKNQTVNFPRVILHARQLSLVHPTTGKQLEFIAELPRELEEIWQLCHLTF